MITAKWWVPAYPWFLVGAASALYTYTGKWPMLAQRVGIVVGVAIISTVLFVAAQPWRREGAR
jgi:hypothetical protein